MNSGEIDYELNDDKKENENIQISDNYVYLAFSSSKSLIYDKGSQIIQQNEFDKYIIGIQSMEVNIKKLKRINAFDKVEIMTDNKSLYFYGKLYLGFLTIKEKSVKLHNDIGLKHPNMLPFFGFCSDESKDELIELRKINFEPFQFTKEILKGLTQ